jgi:hypothetical protein
MLIISSSVISSPSFSSISTAFGQFYLAAVGELNGLKFVHGVSFVKTTYARRRSLFLVVKPGRGGPSCHAQRDGCAGLDATQPPSANAGFTVTPSSVTVRSVRGKSPPHSITSSARSLFGYPGDPQSISVTIYKLLVAPYFEVS